MKTIAIILAAGKGTRFGKSEVNKTAVTIKGKSIIQMGINNVNPLVDGICVVVGYKKESVINSIKNKNINYVIQSKRLGTGHAVKMAINKLQKLGLQPVNILVANGDHLFMIEKDILKKLLKTHIKGSNDVTILTSKTDAPGNLDNGRIIRNNGYIKSILEKTDFKNNDNLISEINTGTYVFNFNSIKDLIRLSNAENGKELYITKLLFNLNKVGSFTGPISKVGIGVNTKKDLISYITRKYEQ